ncbi:MAG: S9 family peptidase [Melioribacteraceae bacterium]|nr:MAG: S9 family peptidase [Melioribacteraceae bacterium]
MLVRKNRFIMFLFLVSILFAEDSKFTLSIDSFLTFGPIKVTLTSGEEKVTSEKLLYQEMDVAKWWPKANEKLFVYANSTLEWKVKSGEQLTFDKSNSASIYYSGFYVETDRFVETELEVNSCNMFSIYLDGNKISDKTTFDENKDGKCEPGKSKTTLQLENGKHFILIKTLFDPTINSDWSINSKLIFDKKYKENVNITLDPIRTTTISDLLNNINVTDISLSPDGKYVALKVRERNKLKDAYENWIELRNVDNGSLVWTFKGSISIPEVDWAPDSKSFAYTSTNGDKKTIWNISISNGTTEALIQDVSNLSGFTWSSNGDYIIYTVNESSKQSDPNFKKYEYPEDRWSSFRDKTSIYRLFVKSKMSELLIPADMNQSFVEISPDSKKLLFSKTYYGESQRPYSRTDYHILDLETMKADSILSLYFASSVAWSPDSKQLLILGGSSTFGEVGNSLSKEIIPNDYDTQAYIYNIESKKVDAITKNFKPQISSAEWDGKNNVIYFVTTDESYEHLYRYDITSSNYEMIDLNVESIAEIDYSENFKTAIFRASSSVIPEKVYKMDLLTGEINLFMFPEETEYVNIKLGEIKDWDFTASSGQKIKGRVYFPPNFDSNKKYPMIVNYYGGTSPVGRDFGGRYPKNIYTANGYIVYILQPSGATGFGVEFSAKHVNDWGAITAQEVIEGTQKFLAEHKFVDPDRVGCIGASYGGFLTMNIITKTDIFSAAISHAGISNLTSYWGVGHWGYLYNAVAGAESFPWNARGEYVDKSPLFNADKITTPLLLLHGNIDPNVPPGESMQMYVALKLLGKDVELVEVDKQEHWILDYDKRTKWTKTILAYFDKYLKDQPEWWRNLYK